jgi:hypothetical protein
MAYYFSLLLLKESTMRLFKLSLYGFLLFLLPNPEFKLIFSLLNTTLDRLVINRINSNLLVSFWILA